MKKPTNLYEVTLYATTYNDDGGIECRQEIGRFETRATSERKAECNARHRSGYPYHGHTSYDSGHWLRCVEADVVQIGGADV